MAHNIWPCLYVSRRRIALLIVVTIFLPGRVSVVAQTAQQPAGVCASVLESAVYQQVGTGWAYPSPQVMMVSGHEILYCVIDDVGASIVAGVRGSAAESRISSASASLRLILSGGLRPAARCSREDRSAARQQQRGGGLQCRGQRAGSAVGDRRLRLPGRLRSLRRAHLPHVPRRPGLQHRDVPGPIGE